MTEENNHQPEKEDVVQGAPAEGEAPGVAPALEALNSRLAETQAKADEYRDGWLRAQAEFQNYKKRVERDNDLTYITLKGDIIRKMLPLLDDMERALQNRPANDAWADGIELIARKLQNTLESEGVKRIEAKGVAFDPNFHEAITHEPSDVVESGHVIDVARNGYTLGERVIRPALVRVAQ